MCVCVFGVCVCLCVVWYKCLCGYYMFVCNVACVYMCNVQRFVCSVVCVYVDVYCGMLVYIYAHIQCMYMFLSSVVYACVHMCEHVFICVWCGQRATWMCVCTPWGSICVSVGGHICVCYLYQFPRGIVCCGAAVQYSCELPDMTVWNWTLVLWKRTKHSKLRSHFSSLKG